MADKEPPSGLEHAEGEPDTIPQGRLTIVQDYAAAYFQSSLRDFFSRRRRYSLPKL